MEYINKIKLDSNYSSDYIYRTLNVLNNKIDIVYIETISDTSDINDYILRKLTLLKNDYYDNFTNYIINSLPTSSITKLDNYTNLIDNLLIGYTILIINNKDFIAIETKKNLSRGINISDYEKSITGPKDSFNEHFNTNVGLIRRRIKSVDLKLEKHEIGRLSKTSIGLMYIKGVCKLQIREDIIERLNKIDIDGIIDSGYIRRWINNNKSLFPTIKQTERPDLASQALLEGKYLIIVDNSPDILILPTFFIDYFHTSDDYYQKSINITFIRIIRLIAFIIAIFLPSYYIAITTYNSDFIPIDMLVNFISQRSMVPFPSFIEAGIMIISFEILRESDIRIPSSMGTSISILGGLVLGDAAVNAGIISPIMIIVVAISTISGLIFQSNEVVNAIRWWRFLLMILSSIFGIYGIFIGIILIITNLSDTKSFDMDYLFPFAPINLKEQNDGIIKVNDKKIKYRNPLLSNNNIRGRFK